MKTFKLLMSFATILLLASSCSSDDELSNEYVQNPQDKHVSFIPSFGPATRATETAFENGDEISVFAVDASKGSTLQSSNYADNVRYRYNSGSFSAVSDGIKISDSNTSGLAYYAVYPYSSSTSATGTFTVNSDQSTHAKYSASDMCTAFSAATTSQQVNLKFSHRLCNVIVELQGDNLASKSVSMRATDVYRSAKFNLNSNTFTAEGSKGDIKMISPYTNAYQCIIAPQNVSKGTTMFVATIDGEEYTIYPLSDMSFQSGCQYTLKAKLEGSKTIAISGDITPWNNGGNGGNDNPDPNPTSVKMESDPALEVYVTSAERVGSVLVVDYTIKNVSGEDINNLSFQIYRGNDEFDKSYTANCAIGEGEYSSDRTISKLKNQATSVCHLKYYDFDPTNKSKVATASVRIGSNNYTFTKNTIDFYVDNIIDNRILTQGIQTPDRNLKFGLTSCTLDEEGNAIINYTVQNMYSDIMKTFTLQLYEGTDDLDKSCTCYVSLNGSEYKYDVQMDLPTSKTITGSIKVFAPSDGAKYISCSVSCGSTSYVLDDNKIRFISIPIQK